MDIRPSLQQLLPPVVKNLLIINLLMFFATFVLERSLHIFLSQYLGLFYFENPFFRPWQLVTHIFMHFDFTHLFFNMFALWMFGVVLENKLGSKKFLIYYLLSGIGAAILSTGISAIQLYVFHDYSSYLSLGLGASGAIYGLLFAFGYLFPNAMVYIPLPVPAKYLILGFVIYAVIAGIRNINAVAQYSDIGEIIPKIDHFAHLSGMIAGFIIFKFWNIKYNTGHLL